MADITPLKFDKDGKLVGEPPHLGPEITDLVLIAHGWTEAADSALEHYRELVDPLEAILSANRAQWQGRSVAYFGVIWPAAKYADDLTVIPDVGDRPPAAMAASLNDEDLKAHAQNVAQFLGIDPELLAAQALQAPDDESARDTLVSTLQRGIPDHRRALADKQTRAEHDVAFENTGSNLFSTIENELQHLKNVADAVANNPFKHLLKLLRSDPKAIIAQILNLFTYYEMKIRSGTVGEGLAKVLDPLLANGKRVHLIGHSFGGRLMTAATAVVKGKISNLTVLEGAFSHNALSSDGENDGAYRSVIDNAKVAGRIVAAHSDHDWAVWIAYPLASWHSHDSYSARLGGPLIQLFGGPNDPYGAMGANGPQHLHDVNQSPFDGTSLPGLNPGVHALDCKSFVAGHGQVWNKGSAYIVAAGLLAA